MFQNGGGEGGASVIFSDATSLTFGFLLLSNCNAGVARRHV